MLSESVIQETTQIWIRTQKRNKNSTLARVILPNCQEHFLLAYLEISKLAACILKHNIINEYIYIYNDKNQVQSRYVDEWNCVRDRKDASRNELLHLF